MNDIQILKYYSKYIHPIRDYKNPGEKFFLLNFENPNIFEISKFLAINYNIYKTILRNFILMNHIQLF